MHPLAKLWPHLRLVVLLTCATGCGGDYRDKSVGELETMLQEGDPAQRTQAAHGLGLKGDQASVAELISVLDAEQPLRVRLEAVIALGKIGPQAAEAIDPLIKLLAEDEEDVVRMQAAAALGKIGQAEALPALEAATSDRSEIVRRGAKAAVKQLRATASD